MERLIAPLPVPARGVAAATIPLTNATSPVYGRQSPTPWQLLDDAINQLDPARPLMDVAYGPRASEPASVRAFAVRGRRTGIV